MFFVFILPAGCYVKHTKSIQVVNPAPVIYTVAQVNSNDITNICWLIQTFKYQSFAFQVLYKPVWLYYLKTNGDFLF